MRKTHRRIFNGRPHVFVWGAAFGWIVVPEDLGGPDRALWRMKHYAISTISCGQAYLRRIDR